MMTRKLILALCALLALAGPARADFNVAGTATNDSATAGSVGEIIGSSSSNATSTVTITIASPAVVTWTAHGLRAGAVVNFTTSGSLPTGLTVGTNYYVIAAGLAANTFEVSASPFGAAVNTSGSQSGTQTGNNNAVLTSPNTLNLGAVSLTAGDWDVSGCVSFNAASTSGTVWSAGLNLTSATLPTQSDSVTAGTGPLAKLGVAAVAAAQNLCTSSARVSLASTTTVYLAAAATFTGTETAFGFIRARRER